MVTVVKVVTFIFWKWHDGFLSVARGDLRILHRFIVPRVAALLDMAETLA
jgi:hypothetical protein